MNASAKVQQSEGKDSTWAKSVAAAGYAIVGPVLALSECDSILGLLGPISHVPPMGRRGGVRNLFASLPELCQLAQSPRLRDLVEPILGKQCFAVGATLFDKTALANWRVPWHQDLTIAVQSQHPVQGWGKWSRKAGVQCVQPSVTILEQMLAVRVHLDPCDVGDGCLRVIPGSHKVGRLGDEDIRAMRQTERSVPCPVPKGGVVLMRPLLLHGSSPAVEPGHRRVVHIEYAGIDLPRGLAWHQRVGPAPGSG